MTIRGTAPFMLAAWIALVGGICLLAGIRQPTMRIPAGLALVLAVGVLSWGRAFSIEIDEHTLHYAAPFRNRVSIKVTEIDKAEIALGANKYRDRLGPTSRLSIKPRVDSDATAFVINLKVFRRRDIHELLRRLSSEGLLEGEPRG